MSKRIPDLQHQIREHMDRARRIFGGPTGSGDFVAPYLEPPVDVYVTDDEVVVLVEVAGIKPEDIQIEVTDETLTVRGERLPLPGRPRRRYTQMEIPTGAFRRSVDLPASVNPEAAQAVYKDGILEVALPRATRVTKAHLRIVVR
jgi:HSP20 family protein